MDLEDINLTRSELEKIKIFAWKRAPFFTIPLQSFPIKVTYSVDKVSVTEDDCILINPKFVVKRRIEVAAALFVACIYILSRFVKRIKFLLKTANSATDRAYMWISASIASRVIAENIMHHDFSDINLYGRRTFYRVINAISEFYTTVTEDDLERMSMEEIAGMLMNVISGIELPRDLMDVELAELIRLIPKLLEEVAKNCDILCLYLDSDVDMVPNKGDEVDGEYIFYPETFNPGDDDYAIDVFNKSLNISKLAGKDPGFMDRVLTNIYESRVPWHIKLMSGISANGHDTTFKVPSRRGYDYPGVERVGRRIYIAIDTSGSIYEDELGYFLGLVMNEARRGATIRVIPWDAAVYDDIEVRSPSMVVRKVAGMMKGGGGTEIKYVLKYLARKVTGMDAVVILTDGEIFDRMEDEVKRLSMIVSSKAWQAIVAYTTTNPRLPGFKHIWADFKTAIRNLKRKGRR